MTNPELEEMKAGLAGVTAGLRSVGRWAGHNLAKQIEDDLAKPISVEGGWRDIALAPKDGTWLLLATAGNEIPFVGMWHKNGWDDGDYRSGMTGMTHWRPLPAPPKTEEG